MLKLIFSGKFSDSKSSNNAEDIATNVEKLVIEDLNAGVQPVYCERCPNAKTEPPIPIHQKLQNPTQNLQNKINGVDLQAQILVIVKALLERLRNILRANLNPPRTRK